MSEVLQPDDNGIINEPKQIDPNNNDNSSNNNDTVTDKSHSNNDFNRCGLFIVSCLYIFFYIGAFFGWGQMQLLLEYNHHFSTLCRSNNTNNNNTSRINIVCTEQTNALIRVQLIAQTVQIMSPLFGYIVDKFGGKCGYYILTINLWCGLSLLVLCSTLSNSLVGSILRIDRLLYVVFILLSTAVSFGGISMIQTGMIFFHHPRTQQRVISTLNALFDAGAITYLILYQLYDAFQIPIVTIFSTYLALSVVLLSAGIYFWNVAKPHDSFTSQHYTDHNYNVDGSTLSRDTSLVPNSTKVRSDMIDPDSIHPNQSPTTATKEEIEIRSATAMNTELSNDSHQQEQTETKANTYIIIAKRTRHEQLVSLPHCCLIIFVGIHATSNQWTLATIRDFLASLGDDDYDNRYLTLFTLLTPVSLLGLPMVDYVIHNYGYHVALQCVNVLGIGYMLVRLCSTDLNIQIIGFILFAIFRCFLYSTFQGLIPILFSTDLVGLVTGILIGVPGITAFLNIPLAKYTIQYSDGNFFVANLLYTLLIIPCIFAAYGIGRTIQNEDQSKNKPTTGNPP